MGSLFSGVAQISGTVAGFGDAARGLGRLSSDISSLASGDFSGIGASSDLGVWAASLRRASWAGVPFSVRESGIQRGRKTAVHEYAFRDTVWVEDLGRATRRYSFRGFLIGDDVYQQRDKMLAAVETAGAQTLVHPSLGTVRASLVEFSCGETAESGRVVEVVFGFIEGGSQLYPSSATSTQDAVTGAAGNAGAATSTDFLSSVTNSIQHGAQAVQGIVVPAQAWASSALKLASDASIASHAVTGLVGNFGRYAGGGRLTPQAGITSVSQALSGVTTARTALTAAAGAVVSLAGAL